MKYIGIDYGTKKVGIAVSNSDGTVAFPRIVLPSDKYLPSIVADIIKDEGVCTAVVGESLSLSGGLNSVASDVQEFVERLKHFTGQELSVHYIDERYTTKLARAIPSEQSARGDVSRTRKSGQQKHKASRADNTKVDAHAAAIILQTFLDKINHVI